MKLPPLRLPQRRKSITLAEANLASYSLNSSAESLADFHKRSSCSLDPSDVAEGKELVITASAKLQLDDQKLPAMEDQSKEDELQEAAVEAMIKTKEKLLVQLAERLEHPGATVDHLPWKRQRILYINESSCHESLIQPGMRTCRICGRDFPSGRALGGHMRVHGGLLLSAHDSRGFGATSVVEQEGRSFKSPACELDETLGSANHASHRDKVQVLESIFNDPDRSLTRDGSSMKSEVPNQTGIQKLDRHGQELHDEEIIQKKEKVMSREHSHNLVRKASHDELLGNGDASCSHDQLVSTGKRKSVSALYELRHNPKPNQRFFTDQDVGVSNASWRPPSYNNSMASSMSIRRSQSPSPANDESARRSCSECGKVFLSWKALFGHMRCHPERDWRGIQPPSDHAERSLELNSGVVRSRIMMQPNASCAKIIRSFADSDSNHQHAIINAGSAVQTLRLANEEETSAYKAPQLLSDRYEPSAKVNLLEKSAAYSYVVKDSAFSPSAPTFLENETREKLKIELKLGNSSTKHAAMKKSGKKKSMKTNYRVASASCKDPGDHWCPVSWLTHNKRSKRTRVLSHPSLAENMSLASETTSDIELKWSQLAPQLDTQVDLDMANCLVMLSNAGALMQEEERSACSDHEKKQAVYAKSVPTGSAVQAQFLEACSWDRELDTDNDRDEAERKLGADPNMSAAFDDVEYHKCTITSSHNAGMKYRCSTCKKCFSSPQALGGHRASHRKMKGCFSQTKNVAKESTVQVESIEENVINNADDAEEVRMWHDTGAHGITRAALSTLQVEEVELERSSNSCSTGSTPKQSSNRSKGHKCSICHRIFASGQALGGHKRCHWNEYDRFLIADTASVASSNRPTPWDAGSALCTHMISIGLAKEDAVDLNLPASLDEDDDDEATFSISTWMSQQDARVQKEMVPATAKRGDAQILQMGNSGATSKWVDATDNCKMKDRIGGKKGSSFLWEPDNIKASSACGSRTDQRSPIWTQNINAAGTYIRTQVSCMLQPL